MSLLKPSFLLWTLFILASCGGGNQESTTTLKVSGGMSLSNTTYQGGLVIVAKSSTGNIATAPLEYAAAGTNTVVLQLPKGIWSFSAVGWDGGSGKFTGGARCGYLDNVNLSQENEAVNLTINATDCANAALFGGNGSASGAFNFNTFSLITCQSFYNNGVSNAVVDLSANPNFCASVGYPEDLQSNASSYRISVPKMIHDGGINLGTFYECINLDAGGLNNSPTLLRLPSKRIPYQIELFKGAGCTGELLNVHLFKDGFASTYPEFDFLYTVGPDRVLISSAGTRKGYTPLLDKVTKFGLPVLNPPLPGSASLLIKPGKEFMLLESASGVPGGPVTCATSMVFGGGDNTATAATCRIEDDKMYVSLNFNIGLCTGPGNDCHLSIGGSGNIVYQYDANDGARIYKDIFEIVGHSNSGSATIMPSIQNHFEKSDNSALYGNFSEIRDMFHPLGPAGFLPAATPCASQVGSYSGSAWDDGILQGYQLTINNDSTQVPGYICQSTPQDICGTSLAFEKVMVLKHIVGPSLLTERVMRFSCTDNLGMLEIQRYKSYGGPSIKEKKLIYWNTMAGNNTRIEAYKFHEQRDSSNVIQQLATSYSRGEQIDANKFIAKVFNFDSHLSGGNYSQHAEKAEYHSNGGTLQMGAYSTQISKISSGPIDIFSAKELADEMNSANMVSDIAKGSILFRSEDINSNGQWVRANAVRTGSSDYDIDLRINSTAYLTSTLNISLANISGLRLKTVMNENGKAVLVWSTGTDIHVIHWDTTTNQWLDTNDIAIVMSTPVSTSIASPINSMSFDVFFHAPSSNDFTVVWHEEEAGTVHVIKAKTYLPSATPTWRTINSAVTSAHNVDNRVYKDIKVVVDASGGFHLAAWGSEGTNYKLARLYCSSIISSALNCPAFNQLNSYVYNLAPTPALAKIQGTQGAVSNEVQFNFRFIQSGVLDSIESFNSNPAGVSAIVSTNSAVVNLHSQGRICLSVANPINSANLTADTECAYINDGNFAPVKSSFKRKLINLQPTSGKFLNVFTPEATFQAQ